MKITFFIIYFLSTSIIGHSQEAVKDSVAVFVKDSVNTITEEERELLDFTDFIGRYKLYPTNNIYNFLKLDTQTGRIWSIQWNTDDKKRFETIVNAKYLINPSVEKTENGRFELQKTDNIYNFLLIDTSLGDVYQVQWALNDIPNLLIRIY